MGQAVPALGLARSHVENAVDLRVLQQPLHKFHAVFYIDKIAHLPAICIVWAAGFKKPQPSGGRYFLVGLAGHAAHVALVVFVGAINIEKFKAGHTVVQLVVQQPQIKQVFGIAVHVQRLEQARVCHTV